MRIFAALFGGQGSQYPGMGKSLFETNAQARKVYECAGDVLGIDIAKISFEGTLEEITRTDICQPALFAHSLAAWEASHGQLPAPTAVAGHSLGEYGALYAAGVFSMEDGFRLVGARGKVMRSAARSAPGTMMAITGSDPDTIRQICQKHGGVWAVNFNLPGQTVIAGAEKNCLSAGEELAGMGARATRLNVDSAFHTPMMQTAADELRDLIKGVKYNNLNCDFYSNLTGGLLKIEDFEDYFVRQMVSPVRFVELITAMSDAGVDACIEFGAGKTASTLAKKNNRAITAMNIECADSLQKTVSAIQDARS